MPLPFLAAIPAALGSLFASGAGALGAGAGGTALASGIGTGIGNIGMAALPGLVGGALQGGGPKNMNVTQQQGPGGGGNAPMGPAPFSPPGMSPFGMAGGPQGMPLGLLPLILKQMGA